jgi:hypothetical protein
VINHTTIANPDVIYVGKTHNESINYSSDYYRLPGFATPNWLKILCVDKADDSLSTGAVIYQSSSQGFRPTNFLYTYGITFRTAGNVTWYYESVWILEGDDTIVLDLDNSIYVHLGASSGKVSVVIINGNIKFGGLSSHIHFPAGSSSYEANFVWKGGSVVAPSGVTKMLDGTNGIKEAAISDVDLTAIGAGATATALVDTSDFGFTHIEFQRCKLPSDAGFVPCVGTWPYAKSGTVKLHHCSSDNKTYDFYEKSYEGQIDDETTIIRTGGASDGTTSQSWKMVSTANVLDNFLALESPPIAAWNTFAVEKTFTVECLVDSATNLQNDEIWMELEYPADNSSGLGAVAKDKCAILGTPADKSAGVGDENWETGSMSNPNSFKCAVTVTSGKAGPVTARIYLAKASTTIYVDPKITVS